MKTKQIPAIVMLIAGLVTCVDSIIQKATLGEFVRTMWIVLILFYIIGFIAKIVLDKSFVIKKEEDLEETTDSDMEEEQAADKDDSENENNAKA